jgi:hypothetical protein
MTTEQIEQTVLAKFRTLPPDKQQEVLDFVEFLEQKSVASQPRSVLGALSHLGIHVSEEDIAEARHEMWGNFPREEPR